MDEDGFVTIADRLKDMIVTGGEDVFSTEVENAVFDHSAIVQCAVFITTAHWTRPDAQGVTDGEAGLWLDPLLRTTTPARAAGLVQT